MTGVALPVPGAFVPEDTNALSLGGRGRAWHVKRPYVYLSNAFLPGVWVPAVYGACQKWDGQAKGYSTYA